MYEERLKPEATGIEASPPPVVVGRIGEYGRMTLRWETEMRLRWAGDDWFEGCPAYCKGKSR